MLGFGLYGSGRKMRRAVLLSSTLAAVVFVSGCAMFREIREPYSTSRDKTKKGAAVGAAAGAAAAILRGEREADEILAGAAVGAVVGTGVGIYMDRQEERFARIPNTDVERVADNVLLVRFNSSILFAVDSALVNEGGRGTLSEVAGVLMDFPKTAVVVQGHTDSTGSEEHNQGLSERRATAVGNYLVTRGVDGGRLTTLGLGEGYPLASNSTEKGRRLNRRVEILLKAKAR